MNGTIDYSEYEIIDAHAHIFPEKIVENATVNIGNFYNLNMNNIGSSQRLIESGKNVGISKYLVFSTATVPKQVESINRFIANECALNSEFIGLGTLHQLSENIENEYNQIKTLGLKGIKLHPDFQDFDIDSKDAYKIYEIAEGELPLLIHFGDERYIRSAPQKFVQVRKDFPNLKIIAAHLGGYQRWKEAQKYLAGMDNVWFDTSSSLNFLSKEDAKSYIENLGIERCMFGTDFPMWNHKQELDLFLSLGFTKSENKKILSENLYDFIKMK